MRDLRKKGNNSLGWCCNLSALAIALGLFAIVSIFVFPVQVEREALQDEAKLVTGGENAPKRIL